jgi:glucose-1-phosphate adenylyltransferase
LLQGCVIEDSLLMGADYYEQYEECEALADCLPLGVGKGTHIRGAIVDKNARIGKFCKIVNAEGLQVGARTMAGVGPWSCAWPFLWRNGLCFKVLGLSA